MTAPPFSVPPPGSDRLGTWLRGKYRVDAVLGVGGMATVFAVTHRNGRRFALKMLYPEYSVRGDLRKRFQREGYIANAVGHTGAVAVLDDDVAEDGSAFLVMELLDGEGLDDVLDRHPGGLPPIAALSAAYQLLDTLVSAHGKNIVHRDIKPGNLFAVRTGEIKVLDFGIARLEDREGKTATRSGVTLGTPAFMAPEQAKGKPLDSRADIYSVGATLFTLLSGRFLHEADNAQELVIKAATEPAPKLVAIAPHVPEVVGTIVDRALAFGADDRWQSAVLMKAAVLQAVGVLTGGGGVSPSQLAPLLTARSRVTEIYASIPEGPPPEPPTEPPPALRSGRSRLAFDGASPTDATLPQTAVAPTNEEPASPITAEPVATTRPSAPGGVQVSLPPRGGGLRIGAAVFLGLAAVAAVLVLRVAGGGADVSRAHAPSATSPVVSAGPAADTALGAASSTVVPVASAASSAASASQVEPVPPGVASASSAGPSVRTVVRVPRTTTSFPTAPTAAASARGASGASSVDPWGTR